MLCPPWFTGEEAMRDMLPILLFILALLWLCIFFPLSNPTMVLWMLATPPSPGFRVPAKLRDTGGVHYSPLPTKESFDGQIARLPKGHKNASVDFLFFSLLKTQSFPATEYHIIHFKCLGT